MDIVTNASIKVIEQGILGVVLVLAATAVVFLYNANQKLQQAWRDDQVKQLEAMHEMASALREVTRVVESSTEISKRLLYRFGGDV